MRVRSSATAWTLLLPLSACGEGTAPPPTTTSYEVRDVVAERLAHWRGELERTASASASPGDAPPPEELVEIVDGLVSMLPNARGSMRGVALEEVAGYGAAAVPALVAVATDATRPDGDRSAAVELLAHVDSAVARGALVDLTRELREGWLRAHCYWRLEETGDDRELLRLLLRLKYEKHEDARVFLARALLAMGNYTPLADLRELATYARDEAVRGRAYDALAAAGDRAGLEERLVSHHELEPIEAARRLELFWAARYSVEDFAPFGLSPDVPSSAHALVRGREPSPALFLEVWQQVVELSSERFQLRGVDDARYSLARLGPWVARELSAALRDEDPYVRLHVAQVLERMDRRAVEAGPALIELLDDPRTGPAAAEALGRVAPDGARTALEARLDPGAGHELRVGALIGLARLGDTAALPAVRPLFTDEGEPADLRRTAARTLVSLGAGDVVARFLLDELGDPLGDPSGAELGLEEWLARGAGELPVRLVPPVIDEQSSAPGGEPAADAGHGDGRFARVLAAWRAADPTLPDAVPTYEETRARRDARAALLREEIGALLAPPGGG